MPIAGMWLLGIGGAVVAGLSFQIIPYWPLPPSIEPYYGWDTGAVWGLAVGLVTGLVIGYLVDERHF